MLSIRHSQVDLVVMEFRLPRWLEALIAKQKL